MSFIYQLVVSIAGIKRVQLDRPQPSFFLRLIFLCFTVHLLGVFLRGNQAHNGIILRILCGCRLATNWPNEFASTIQLLRVVILPSIIINPTPDESSLSVYLIRQIYVIS